MLLLARGQLNRAFRAHGLVPPDPLPVSALCRSDPVEVDDPAAKGLEYARARHGEAFTEWTKTMPMRLVPPVLDILRQTGAALGRQQHGSREAVAAVSKAYELLLDCSQANQKLPSDGAGLDGNRVESADARAG